MSSPKPSADVIPATVTFDHRLVTKGIVIDGIGHFCENCNIKDIMELIINDVTIHFFWNFIGSTTNKRRRRRPSSRNSTHMSSPERSKKLKRDSTEEVKFMAMTKV